MAKAKAKRPPKTTKEKAFVSEYLKTGNATESASRVYDTKSRDVARNIGSQNVAKLSFFDIFDNQGLTDQVLVSSIVEATKATKYNYNKETPDWNTRIKAVELCLKLKGSFSLAELQNKQKLDKEKRESSEDILLDSMTDKEKELLNLIHITDCGYKLTNKQRKKAILSLQTMIGKSESSQDE